MIYFASDFHYGHANITGEKISRWTSGFRDFDSLKDMNEAIVDSVNSIVKENDILVFGGDWSFGPESNIEKLRNLLKVKDIRFVYGNHDETIRKYYRHLFTFVGDLYQLKHPDIIVTHYAMRVWNKSHRGSIHLYGHSHHTLPEIGKSMDIGWCKWRRPLSLDEIVEIMKDRPIYQEDAHE